MILKLRTMGITDAQGLRQQVESCADRVLGRLKRSVSHVIISLREHERDAGDRVYVCTLRLRVPGNPDTLIESLRTETDAAVDNAFRCARREILRRRRGDVRDQQSLPSPG